MTRTTRLAVLALGAGLITPSATAASGSTCTLRVGDDMREMRLQAPAGWRFLRTCHYLVSGARTSNPSSPARHFAALTVTHEKASPQQVLRKATSHWTRARKPLPTDDFWRQATKRLTVDRGQALAREARWGRFCDHEEPERIHRTYAVYAAIRPEGQALTVLIGLHTDQLAQVWPGEGTEFHCGPLHTSGTYDWDATKRAMDAFVADLRIGPPAKRRYRVEYKAWIPSATAGDPFSPAPIAGPHLTLVRPLMPARVRSCLDGAGSAMSVGDGDGHTGYGALGGARSDFRVLAWAEFDWDGERISSFRRGTESGLSRRMIFRDGASSPACEQTAYAPTVGSVRRTGSDGFQITVDAPAPVTPATAGDLPALELGLACGSFVDLCGPLRSATLTPAINGRLVGRFRDGRLHLGLTSDRYPSHGFAVTLDGRPGDRQRRKLRGAARPGRRDQPRQPSHDVRRARHPPGRQLALQPLRRARRRHSWRRRREHRARGHRIRLAAVGLLLHGRPTLRGAPARSVGSGAVAAFDGRARRARRARGAGRSGGRARAGTRARRGPPGATEQTSRRVDELTAQLRDVDTQRQGAERELAVAAAQLDAQRRAHAELERRLAEIERRAPSARAAAIEAVEEAARGGRRPRHDRGEP